MTAARRAGTSPPDQRSRWAPRSRRLRALGVGASPECGWRTSRSSALSPDLLSITTGATKTAPGLGLWPDAIVDQHFLRRQRHSRLISLLLEHPNLVAVGIDEKTAVVVSGKRFEVIGESTVLVLDARKARVEPRQPGQLGSARGITLRVLTAGMGFDCK